MRRTLLSYALAVGVAGATAMLAVGCSDDGGGTTDTADSSTKTDAGKDSGGGDTGPKPDASDSSIGPADTSPRPDAGHDSATDAPVDSPVDAPKDSPADVVQDTSPGVDAADTGSDTGTDATLPDAALDAGIDAGADTAAPDASSTVNFNSPLQVDVSSVLNANIVVTTTAGGTYASMDRSNWDFPTQSKAVQLGVDPNGLPDNAFFSADAPTHPVVQLHWNNAVNQPNGRVIQDAVPVSFPVPIQNYTQIQLFGLSTEGATTIDLLVTYQDNTTSVRSAVAIADWFNNPTADQFILIDGLDRIENATTYENANNPGIFGVNANPDVTKAVKQITITNTGGGFFVFYGATAF